MYEVLNMYYTPFYYVMCPIIIFLTMNDRNCKINDSRILQWDSYFIAAWTRDVFWWFEHSEGLQEDLQFLRMRWHRCPLQVMGFTRGMPHKSCLDANSLPVDLCFDFSRCDLCIGWFLKRFHLVFLKSSWFPRKKTFLL